MTWEGLSPPYATIVADPPWLYADRPVGWHRDQRRAALPYSTMSVNEIKALPVAQLTRQEGYLFLWTTSHYLEDAFAVTRAWKFKPQQVLVWCKPPRGDGLGGMFTTTTEFVIVAQRIGPRAHARRRNTTGQRIDRSWFEWPRGEHSAKPPAFLDLVEQVCPGPYVELFARQPRLGWDSWGRGYEHARWPMSVWRLEIEAPDGRIHSANDGRPHWTLTNRRRQEWRLLGFLHARQARWPRLQAAELHITLRLRNWRTADAHNYPGGPSLKGLIDGLVNAKVVPDDCEPYLTVHMPRLAPLAGGPPRVALELRERGGS